ncbi:MAG: hypothetical protein HY747_04715 [Elusimicrobia bacterium]|nr:hypothetical protein [Elusimicrobiota bacterium]
MKQIIKFAFVFAAALPTTLLQADQWETYHDPAWAFSVKMPPGTTPDVRRGPDGVSVLITAKGTPHSVPDIQGDGLVQGFSYTYSLEVMCERYSSDLREWINEQEFNITRPIMQEVFLLEQTTVTLSSHLFTRKKFLHYPDEGNDLITYFYTPQSPNAWCFMEATYSTAVQPNDRSAQEMTYVREIENIANTMMSSFRYWGLW